MNWDAIGAVGEIVGAIAVFLSLTYLAIQLRDSNRAAKNAVVREIMDKYSATYGPIGESTESSEHFLRGLADDETLTPAELFRFRVNLVQSVLVWERMYYLTRDNEIDPWVSEGMLYVRKLVVGAPGFQSWFKVRKLQISREFREVLEKEIETATEYSAQGIELNLNKNS